MAYLDEMLHYLFTFPAFFFEVIRQKSKKIPGDL